MCLVGPKCHVSCISLGMRDMTTLMPQCNEDPAVFPPDSKLSDKTQLRMTCRSGQLYKCLHMQMSTVLSTSRSDEKDQPGADYEVTSHMMSVVVNDSRPQVLYTLRQPMLKI